jgi:hypothetical protein
MAGAKRTLRQRWNYGKYVWRGRFWRSMPERARLLHYSRAFSRAAAAVQRKGNRLELEKFYAQEEAEMPGIAFRLSEIETAYWLRKARRYHVPALERTYVPEGKNWMRAHDNVDDSNYSFLTDEGIYGIRSLIREEQKYRREARLAYVGIFVQIASVAIGLGGTIIGIIAATRRR